MKKSIVSLGIVLLLAGVQGCREEGPLERLGREVDEAAKETREAAKEIRDTVETK